MPVPDFTASTDSASGDFPGTGDNSLYGIGAQLAVYPVMLQRAAPARTGTAVEFREQAPTMVPYESALALLYKLPGDQILTMQQDLVTAGLLKDGSFTPALADPQTFNAYKDVVTIAARSGRPLDEVLAEAKANGAAVGAKNAKGPLTVQLTNPDDLRAIIKAGATKVYGHSRIDEGLIDKIVAGYQAQERQAQTAVYNDAGTVTAPANPSSYVEAQLTAANPGQVAQNQQLSTRDDFFDLLRSTGSS